MKCPECERKHPYKSGMRCLCGYRFCLDPKRDGIADGRFLAMVRKASSNDTYHFTENQLYTVFCRKSAQNPWGCFVTFLVLAGLTGLFGWLGWGLTAFTGIGAILALVAGVAAFFSRPPSRQKVHGWVEKWLRQHPLEKLIREPRLHEPPPEWSEPDIYDYGVEGIVIVQRDVLVDLLVLNDFHSAQRVLVLAESGYPQYLIPVARKCLEENPELPVYLLHDADPPGLTMADRVRDSGMLPLEGHPVTDMGLTPDDARNLKRLKPTRPERADYAIPVDTLTYGVLAGGLALAVSEQVALGELLEQFQQGQRDDTTTHFG